MHLNQYYLINVVLKNSWGEKMKKNIDKDPIDFIVLWVDDSDEKWIADKNKYSETKKIDAGNANRRYRDWNMLKYWFRGVEKYASWVNKIHFVTYGHLPKWLDTTNPKINIVKHEDIIPKKYLPTFNSNVIQFYLNRIEGLSEKFVLFDDDFYIINKVRPTDFFVGDKIRTSFCETPINFQIPGNVYAHSLMNNVQYINKYYNKKKFYKKNFFKLFSLKNGLKNNFKTLLSLSYNEFKGIANEHFCYENTKKHYDLFWKYCNDDLLVASNNKFRKHTDLTTLLVKQIAVLEGDFVPRSYKFGKRFTLTSKKEVNSICNAVSNKKYHIICINDNIKDEDFEYAKQKLIEEFEKQMPEKCSFERM